MHTPVRRTASIAAGIAVAMLAAAPITLAARTTTGTHRVTAHHGANVRAATADGGRTNQYIGHLRPADKFRVVRHAAAYCFGHAAGHVNHDGWVLCASLSSTTR
jgi:MFS superfamily sulfate permease-like transporter